MTKKSKLLLTASILTILPLTTLSVVSCSNSKKENELEKPDFPLYDKEYGLEFNADGVVLSSYIPKEHVVIPEYLTFNSIQSSKYYGYKVKVREIGEDAFNNNQIIKEVTIADSVTKIDDNAFANTQLTQVTIPDSVQYLSGFNGTKITSINIPNSVETIGNSAFENTQLTQVTIPNSVTIIASAAFADTHLTQVTIPDSVTKINYSAFQNTKLTQVTIPDSVKEIGTWAFLGTQLTKVTLPQNCKYDSSSFPSNCVVEGGIRID